MTALHTGCLAANAPARSFYEAIGGRLSDEDGVMLPEVYEWTDIQTLVPNAEHTSEERRPA